MDIQTAARAELVTAYLNNLGEMVDAFIAANIDPQDDATETEAIRAVIQQWIEDGDECAAA